MEPTTKEPLLALDQLAAYPHWVCGDIDKIPYDPKTGQKARANDPTTWGNFEQATSFLEAHKDNSIRTLGFEVGESPFLAIDLDHCRDPETGVIEPWAQEIVSTVNSYTEGSPSNSGVRIFVTVKNDFPAINRKKGGLGPSGKGALEVANSGKYFSVTGNHLEGTPDWICSNSEGLQKIIDQYFPPKPLEVVSVPKPTVTLEDEEIIRKAENARNGAAFKKLYSGYWNDYASHSEADLAFCSLLAFWCGNDPEQIDRIFRQSGLCRAKWDRADYRQETINKAIAGTAEIYQGHMVKADVQTMQAGTLGASEPISTDAPLPSEDVLDGLRRNEDGDARLFQELHRGRFCYDGSSGRWYSWKTHSWERDTLGEATRAIDGVVDAYSREADRQSWQRLQAEKAGRTQEANQRAKTIDALYKRIRSLQTVTRKENILTLARTGADSLAIRGDEWDRDPWLLACPNGIIDLRTGKLRPGTPDDYIKTVAPVEYHGKNTPAPHFDRFISEVFNHDQELIGFIQRLLGYALTGDTSEHITPILWGMGRNGKSTLIEIVSFILGAYAGQIESEMLLIQKFGRQSGGPSPDIMALRGKRFVHCSETESGRHFNLSKVKWLSGGDTLTGRELYGKELVTFRPTHKIVLSTNHKPHASADDYAFWKRALLIPFNLSFIPDPKEPHERKADPQLPEKLKAEAPGILSWMVRGCLEWQKQRLNPPDCVKAATEEYRDDEDIIKHFIDDRCLVAPELSVKALVLYKAYRLWCEEMGHVPLNGTNFAIKIKAKFGSKRTMHGFVYFGFDLLAGA